MFFGDPFLQRLQQTRAIAGNSGVFENGMNIWNRIAKSIFNRRTKW